MQREREADLISGPRGPGDTRTPGASWLPLQEPRLDSSGNEQQGSQMGILERCLWLRWEDVFGGRKAEEKS